MKSRENETPLLQALQGLPTCNRLRFCWEDSAATFLDLKEADKAIKLGQKLKKIAILIFKWRIDENMTSDLGWIF